LEEKFFPIGIHYEYPFGGMCKRPEWLPKGPEDWKQDLNEIKKTGFNIIRIRIGFDCNLDDVEKLLDMASKERLKVIFGFATFYVSDDFVQKYPDSRFVNADGSVFPEGVHDYRWQRACINHPVYLKMRNKLIEDCVKRFKDHETIYIWDVHNEPSIRHCYCPNTIKEFRNWLKKVYGDISSLNKDWGTSFEDFESVEPPRAPESSESMQKQWETWGEFTIANLKNFLQSGIDIIKKYDPDRPVTFNFVGMNMYRGGVDWWFGRELDMVTMSVYTSWGQHRAQIANIWHDFDLLRSITGKNPWIMEWQAGPNNGDPFYSGDDIRIETFNALGHGVKGIIFYRWEPLMNRIEPWVHCMVEPGNYETERRQKTREMIKELKSVEDVLLRGVPPKGDVAIYMPRFAVATILDIKQTRNSSVGYHALLNDLGYEVEFITDHFKRSEDYKLVIIPAIVRLKQSEIREINAYLENGGNVIFEPTLNDVKSCAAELEWLGLKPTEIDSPIYFLVGWELRNSKNEFVCWAFHKRAIIEEPDESMVEYRFYDGKPAILRISRGGNLIVTMFPFGWTYLTCRLKGLRSIFKQWLTGVEPAVHVNVSENVRPLIKAKVLKTKEHALLLVTSKATSKVKATIKVKGYKEIRTVLQPFTAEKYLLKKRKSNN